MADQPTQTAAETPARPSVVVKKYANRRLYNTETSSYITLDNLAEMIRAGRDFAVYDAKTGDDITRGVLTQIIVEEESKGSSMLPTTFLRSLIGFYGDSLQGVVPSYLEQAMNSFALQQKQMREVMQQTFGSFMPPSVGEMGRQNMAMMERAMSMFNPFARAPEPARPAAAVAGGIAPSAVLAAEAEPEGGAEAEGAASAPAAAAPAPEVEALRREVEGLRSLLAVAHAELAVSRAPHPHPVPAAVPAQAPNVLADLPAAKTTSEAAPLSAARGRRNGKKA